MSNFLKKVIKNIVEGFGINHKEWIDPNFTDEKRKRRERARKKSTPSDIERQEDDDEDDDDLTDDEQQTDLNNSNMEADHNDSGTDRQGSVANDLILEETFTQEIEIDGSNPGVDETMQRQGSSDTNVSNISDLLHNNGIDLGNMDNSQGFATSTLRGQPRRCSARQAAKRARLHSVPRPPIPPRPVSPLSEEPSTSTSAPLPPSPPRSSFVPRRRPLGNGRGCSNFRSPLNVNVGQEFSSDNTILELHIPSDLVSEFGKLSKTNTDNGLETGGVIAGVYLGTHYQVTHLLIPEQRGAPDSWEVWDERQITNHFVYNPNLILLGLIHTHPKMTSFLSSVDLHALWDFARENHSIVSIVLAPEKKTCPAFCLTRLGLSELAQCKQGGFHKHKKDDRRLYEEAEHAIDDQSLATIVVDFRILRNV